MGAGVAFRLLDFRSSGLLSTTASTEVITEQPRGNGCGSCFRSSRLSDFRTYFNHRGEGGYHRGAQREGMRELLSVFPTFGLISYLVLRISYLQLLPPNPTCQELRTLHEGRISGLRTSRLSVFAREWAIGE
jgi:hypothetical protein